jgi:DNA-binding transcriptional MerR regulator
MNSYDVVRLTGVTYRQLDWWVRQGYIETTNVVSGSGCPRDISAEEAKKVVRIKLLIDAGLANQMAILIATDAYHEDRPCDVEIRIKKERLAELYAPIDEFVAQQEAAETVHAQVYATEEKS